MAKSDTPDNERERRLQFIEEWEKSHTIDESPEDRKKKIWDKMVQADKEIAHLWPARPEEGRANEQK